MSVIYHDGSRELQNRFDTRRIADRIEEVLLHDFISEHDAAFIEDVDMFFIATADEDGRPNCSYKGGEPGFVRVVDEKTIAFPNYDGNGMYITMGEICGRTRTSGCSSSASRTRIGYGSMASRASTRTIR